MGNAMEAMKRKYLRVVADMEIEVCLLPGDDSKMNKLAIKLCTARDISGGGLSFYGRELYPEFSLLRLHIPMNSETTLADALDEDTINVMGKVIWSRRRKDGSDQYATGVQFLNIYEKDFQLLEKYVQEHSSI